MAGDQRTDGPVRIGRYGRWSLEGSGGERIIQSM